MGSHSVINTAPSVRVHEPCSVLAQGILQAQSGVQGFRERQLHALYHSTAYLLLGGT